MEITLAEKTKLIEVLYIIRECSRQLIEKGIKYWNNSLADYNDISDDITNQFVYLLIIDKVTIGTFTIKTDKYNPKALVISRLAIYPSFQKRGLTPEVFKFVEDLANKKGATILKGLAPADDKSLGQLLEENGFVNQGVDNEIPEEFIRIKFEKILG